MKLKRPCRNPHDNIFCEEKFRPIFKGKLCDSCRRLSSHMAHEKRKITMEERKVEIFTTEDSQPIYG